jgi:VanZ family protein
LSAVSKARSFIKYWLPTLMWMALIFSASGDANSCQRSSRIIGPILRWLFPDISDAALTAVVTIVRKCAHLAEYAVLAMLWWRALRKPARSDPRPWSWAETGWAVLFVALYAATDEFHQFFVSSRNASVLDVMIDTTGAILGLLLLWALDCRRRRRLKDNLR